MCDDLVDPFPRLLQEHRLTGEDKVYQTDGGSACHLGNDDRISPIHLNMDI